MIRILRRALALLDTAERRRLFLLLLLAALAAVLQAVAILSIMPFIVLLANPEILSTSAIAMRAYAISGAESYTAFLTLFGAFGLLVMTLGNGILALEQWLSHRYIVLLGHRIEKLVLRRMLGQPYERHVKQHSARLADVVLVQVERVVDGVVGSFLSIFGSAALTLLIVAMLLVVSPATTLVTLLALFVAYLGVFLLLRRRIIQHGETLTELSGATSTHLREMLDGIREIKVRSAEKYFADRFDRSNLAISLLAVRYGVLTFLPHFMLETLVFAGLIGVALFFILATDNPGAALAYIALYGMSIYRLVPALKGVFEGIAEMHHNEDAIRVISEHIDAAETPVPQHPIDVPARAIELRGVAYSYGGEREVRDISLELKAGSSLCLFGPSGSGKSTLLNLIAGLLRPQSGAVLVDGTALRPEHDDSWRTHIGYCPQQVFLFDDTVACNIAFGVPAAEIDPARIREVAGIAMIRDFVETTLADGFDTRIGEDGKTLSGGQQQRLGIARCLYHDPSVVLLDESFTGLDAATRDAILDALFALSGKTLVLSTHDVDVARRCEAIALVEGGRLLACDSYDGVAAQIAASTARRSSP